MPPFQKSAVFLNIVQKAFDPPPFIWTFVLFCGGYFLNAFLSIENGSNIIFFITSNINAYHSQKRHCPPPWSVQMSACQRRQGCSTSPFGQRTFATRPPSKAEDMGLSQGSFVSFLEERVKEVFTSIHVSVESTKPAEVYTTRRWHSWELRRELAMSFETDMKYM